MSTRVASNPVTLPKGTEVSITADKITVKGPKGNLSFDLHRTVQIAQEEQVLKVALKKGVPANEIKYAGTTRAIVNNMVIGVTNGFEKKLILEGTGYRAQLQGNDLNLTLGFSHPVVFKVPEGITAECPSNKEIVLKGIDKQKVGQAAANIRAYRPPEPYKGKGVRYSDERIQRKEVKKK